MNLINVYLIPQTDEKSLEKINIIKFENKLKSEKYSNSIIYLKK